jgi:hypothetical protein
MGIDGIKIDPKKIKTIAKWTRPKYVSQLHSFLGFYNYCRRFIQDYSTLVALLTLLTIKDVKFTWTIQ